MTHRDRAGDAGGQEGAAGPAGHRQGFPTHAGGSPVRPGRRLRKGFRAASRAACDAGASPRRSLRRSQGRRATRSWPKTLGSRLYESLSALLGIRWRSGVDVGVQHLRRNAPIGEIFARQLRLQGFKFPLENFEQIRPLGV